MTPELIAALVGGGGVAGVVVDRLLTWALNRRTRRVDLLDRETLIAERLLARVDAALADAEADLREAQQQIDDANATIRQLRAQLAAALVELDHLRQLQRAPDPQPQGGTA